MLSIILSLCARVIGVNLFIGAKKSYKNVASLFIKKNILENYKNKIAKKLRIQLYNWEGQISR